jgi:hypothetical protein
MDAIAKAHQLGTLNAQDRSRQYEDMNQAQLLRAVNDAWAKIRGLEAAGLKKDQALTQLHRRVDRYRWVNIALTSIVTALAVEGVKALVPYLAGFLSR